MKKYKQLIFTLAFLIFFGSSVSYAATILSVPQGGSGASTLTGIIKGNGTSPFTAVSLPADASKYLDGTGAFSVPAGGTADPCTTTGSSIQYDAAGNFGCVSGVTSNGTLMQFASGALKLSGASSGAGLLNAPAAASTYTWTLPAATDTLAGLTATQAFTNKTLTSSTNSIGGVTVAFGSDATGDTYYGNSSQILTRLGIGSTGQLFTVSGGLPAWVTYTGSSSITTVGTITSGTWNGTKIGLAYGGTNADLSATGGTSQVLKQTSSGAAITVGQLAASDLSNGTTGSGGGVVLATGPTLSNPVVGTQSASDNSTKAASTAYVTGAISTAISGVNPAIAVQVATTAASDTSGFTYANGVSGVGATLTQNSAAVYIVDGFTFTTIGQRILVKNDTQSPSGAFNGIYTLTTVGTSLIPTVFTRALDYDQPSDMNNTGSIPVVNGTANGSTSWVLTSAIATIGTDPLTFAKFTLNPSTIITTSTSAGGDLTGTYPNPTIAKIQGTVVSGTTGSTNVVFSNSPTLVTPALGTPSAINLTNATYTGLIEEIGMEDSTTSISAQTYTLDLYPAYGYTINTMNIIATSGTATAALKINGTNVTSCSSVSISSSIASCTASGANTVSAGASNSVTLVISSPSSLNNLQVSIKTTRT